MNNASFKNIAPMWDANGCTVKGWSNTFNMPFQNYNNNTPVEHFQNGRVTNISNNNTIPHSMTMAENNTNNTTKNTILSGTISRSPLSETFFSELNMKRLQDMLRFAVYKASGNKYVIGKQNTTDLIIIMRAMYLQYAKHLPTQLKEQVYELNNYVVDFSLHKILSEVKQYLYYVKDIQQLPIPLDHPKNLSSAGTRSLRSVTSTF